MELQLMTTAHIPSSYSPTLRMNHPCYQSSAEVTYNLAYVSFSVLVCPSVLTMSFPAPCADSARPPGMLTCRTVLFCLLKKSGKVFVTLFPRFPPPWPTPLWRQVFDVIKTAMSLMVCFLQRRFHHRWQNHGAIFITKI
jgi:hypothetical protein